MRWRPGGWLTGAKRLASPNQEARPPGSQISLIVIHAISLPPDRFGGDFVERFFHSLSKRERLMNDFWVPTAVVEIPA